MLFRVRDEVADPELLAAMRLLRALGQVADAVEWRVERSLDARKGRIIVQDATFASSKEFEAFRALEAHQAAGKKMSEIADWLVGDFDS